MQALTAIFLAFALTACVPGCGPRDSTYDPSKFHITGLLAPPDAILPRNARLGANADGLYTIAADSSENCCLIAPQVQLNVRKELPGNVLRLGVYVPKVRFFRLHSQQLTIRFMSVGIMMKSVPLGIGAQVLTFTLPASVRRLRGDVSIAIHAKIAYIPRAAGDSLDDHSYALVLSSIYFE